MDDYLTKPLDRAQLADTIARHLKSASPPPNAARRDAASEPPAGADAPVDWDQLMTASDGDAVFAQELVQLFIDSGDATLQEIRAALKRGDLAAIGCAAHSFKGSSASIRARSASAAAARLEEAAHAGAVEKIPQLEEQLRLEAGRAMDYLRARSA